MFAASLCIFAGVLFQELNDGLIALGVNLFNLVPVRLDPAAHLIQCLAPVFLHLFLRCRRSVPVFLVILLQPCDDLVIGHLHDFFGFGKQLFRMCEQFIVVCLDLILVITQTLLLLLVRRLVLFEPFLFGGDPVFNVFDRRVTFSLDRSLGFFVSTGVSRHVYVDCISHAPEGHCRRTFDLRECFRAFLNQRQIPVHHIDLFL